MPFFILFRQKLSSILLLFFLVLVDSLRVLEDELGGPREIDRETVSEKSSFIIFVFELGCCVLRVCMCLHENRRYTHTAHFTRAVLIRKEKN